MIMKNHVSYNISTHLSLSNLIMEGTYEFSLFSPSVSLSVSPEVEISISFFHTNPYNSEKSEHFSLSTLLYKICIQTPIVLTRGDQPVSVSRF